MSCKVLFLSFLMSDCEFLRSLSTAELERADISSDYLSLLLMFSFEYSGVDGHIYSLFQFFLVGLLFRICFVGETGSSLTFIFNCFYLVVMFEVDTSSLNKYFVNSHSPLISCRSSRSIKSSMSLYITLSLKPTFLEFSTWFFSPNI